MVGIIVQGSWLLHSVRGVAGRSVCQCGTVKRADSMCAMTQSRILISQRRKLEARNRSCINVQFPRLLRHAPYSLHRRQKSRYRYHRNDYIGDCEVRASAH